MDVYFIGEIVCQSIYLVYPNDDQVKLNGL